MKKESKEYTAIFVSPLFLTIGDATKMGKEMTQLMGDHYNKAEGNALIDAQNDAEAVSAFLQEFQNSPLTLRAYAKEVERLLLWCMHVCKLNISSLRRNHLVEYQAFLRNPEPKALWCGKKVSRQSKDGSPNRQWRPFNTGFSDVTLNKTISILDSFFNYLVQTHYLSGNPMAVDKRRKKRNQTRSNIIDRYLELDEIHATLDAIAHSRQTDEQNAFQQVRAKYIILLLFYTGLRIAESANHTMGDFVQRGEDWFLRIIGKGNKLREIPVPDALLDALADFRLAVGLPSPQPNFNEKTPLIPMENLTQPITTRRIDQILKWAFGAGAHQFEVSYPRKASKLRAASAHWLRHSYVTYLLNSGAPLKVAQENAGHSNISTTMHYTHVAQTDRHEATRQLSLVIKKG